MGRKEKSEYFNGIAKDIISKAIFDFGINKVPHISSAISFVFRNHQAFRMFNKDGDPIYDILHKYDRASFIRYVKENYDSSLTDNDYVNIWERFKRLIIPFMDQMSIKVKEEKNNIEPIIDRIVTKYLKDNVYDSYTEHLNKTFVMVRVPDKGSWNLKNMISHGSGYDYVQKYLMGIYTLPERLQGYLKIKFIERAKEFIDADLINESISKIEKFYSYIIDYLLKNTEVDISGDRRYRGEISISFPWLDYTVDFGKGDTFSYDSLWPEEIEKFMGYVISRFGCNEADCEIVRDRFFKKVFDNK